MSTTGIWSAIAIASLGFGVPGLAQTVNSVRIDPGHPQAHYAIDGQFFTGPAVLMWPEGSKHTLGIPYTDPKIKLEFKKWSTNLQPDVAVPMLITASKALTSVTAEVAISYSLMVSYFHRDPNMPNAASPGMVCASKPGNT